MVLAALALWSCDARDPEPAERVAGSREESADARHSELARYEGSWRLMSDPLERYIELSTATGWSSFVETGSDDRGVTCFTRVRLPISEDGPGRFFGRPTEKSTSGITLERHANVLRMRGFIDIGLETTERHAIEQAFGLLENQTGSDLPLCG